jgi:nucleoid-associated protein YgaU
VSNRGARGTGRAAPMRPWRRNTKWSMALGGIVVVFVVLAGYDLISGGVLSGGPSASSATSSAAARRGAARTTAPSAAAAPVTPAASVPPSPSTSPSASAGAGPAQALTVASAAAFGPDGTSDGDNPGLASRVVDGGGAWSSSWYTTPEFGDLQSGTGILLDMGQPVTVSSIGLVLGDASGADLQVRVGDTAVFGDMTTAASMTDVGGTVRLPLSASASAQYVLIWFTRLPPNSQGTYQVSLYSATVDGHA